MTRIPHDPGNSGACDIHVFINIPSGICSRLQVVEYMHPGCSGMESSPLGQVDVEHCPSRDSLQMHPEKILQDEKPAGTRWRCIYVVSKKKKREKKCNKNRISVQSATLHWEFDEMLHKPCFNLSFVYDPLQSEDGVIHTHFTKKLLPVNLKSLRHVTTRLYLRIYLLLNTVRLPL